MTEQAWLECTDPAPMLEFVRDSTSDRKLRLVAVACCYRLWEWLSEECCQKLMIFERHADDPRQPDVGDFELETAFEASAAAAPEAVRGAFDAGLLALWEYWDVVTTEEPEENEEEVLAPAPSLLKELESQTHLVRDIIGNPFRPTTIDPRWRTSTAIDLARIIYNEAAFDRMPVLADALMDAGCDSEEIIAHCRQSGEHVRGCWLVDLILGKS